MSCKEAERWLAELTADPERMSAKILREGYAASLRKSGAREAEISRLLRKSRQVYYNIVEDKADNVDWRINEALITKTYFDPEDIHYRAAALHQVRQRNRCLAALKTSLH